MKRYDSYKDSGVQWIGEIPSHWEGCRFKNFLNIKSEKSNSSHKVGLENIESQTGRYVVTDTEFDGDGVGFHVGDILYGKLRPYLQKVWLTEFDGNAVGDFFVFACKPNSNNVYVKYLMLSDCFTKEADGSTFGAKMPRVASDFILTLPFYLPPINEQTAIANYLDNKCSKIDNVIATQEKRVELLRELKQSIITRAVTRGFPSTGSGQAHAKMKDSGVEWIGEIPEHWDVKKLKYLFANLDYLRQPITADQRSKENPIYDYYGASGVIDKIDFYNVDDTVLLIGEDGANLVFRNLPLIYKATGKFWVNNHAHILKPLTGVDYEYMFYTMECADYSTFITGSAQPKLSQEKMNQVQYPLPPLSEQQAIVTYIEQQTSRLDSSITKALRQIELLKEYKQSLITEVVTGKRKVC